MTYRKVPAPKEYEPGWIDQELEKIEQMLLGTDNFRIKERHVEPPKPRLGDVYLADGVDWDPGSGPGAYLFDGTNFVLLGFDGTLASGSVDTAELADGAVTTVKIGDDQVTFAKMQEIATQRVVGRNTAATGNPEEVTILQMLNWLANSNRGDLIRRGASDWETLNVGASGQVLQSDGTDPVWAEATAPGLVLLTSGAISSPQATLDIVLTTFSAYRALKFVLSSFVPATDDVELWMRFSTDGGANYDATGYAWIWTGNRDGSATPIGEVDNDGTEIVVAGRGPTASQAVSNVAAEGGADAEITLHGFADAGRYSRVRFSSAWTSADAQLIAAHGAGMRETAQNTDAVRFLFETGDIASGNWAVYGLV